MTAPAVVIIGAGTAGIPAALAALELGAQVELVEKTDRVGGMLWASGAVLSGAGSRRQREAGIEDSPEAHQDEVRATGRDRADPRLLQLAIELAGPTIDWLEEIGTTFTADSPLVAGLADNHELYRVPRSYLLEAPAELGPYRGPVLAERLRNALARWAGCSRLRTRFHSRATSVVLDEAGAVAGCRVAGPGGIAEVPARAVILCTGGYAGSRELMQRLHPGFKRLISQGLAHATGDGIRLAEGAGGSVVNEDIVIPMLGAIEDPDRPGFRLPNGMIAFGRPPAVAGDIWVNAEGRRFVAEDAGSPDLLERALLGQPGRVMSVIFDEAMRRGLAPAVASWTSRCLGDPPDPRIVVSAPSIGKLAQRLQVPADNLEATVAEYNRAVVAGADQIGRRAMPAPISTPPYHAVPTASAVIVTFAGIRVDARLRVVGRSGTPVTGLYAAGEVLGGGQVQGDGFSSGMSVTPAIAFGRLAARNAIEDMQTTGARRA